MRAKRRSDDEFSAKGGAGALTRERTGRNFTNARGGAEANRRDGLRALRHRLVAPEWNDGPPRQPASDEITSFIGWLRHENSAGAHIYIRPAGPHALTLIDD